MDRCQLAADVYDASGLTRDDAKDCFVNRDSRKKESMRLLTKAEACRELRMSLSTLDRRIADGELQAMREPHGKRHRVYVILDDEPPGKDKDMECGNTALAVAQG